MTEAETMAIISGHQITMSQQASNFRNVFAAMVRLWSKEKKPIEQLWELPTDYREDDMPLEERFELYNKIKAQC